MRIGIDLDGVLYDFAASLKHYLINWRQWHRAACRPDPTRWEFYLDWGLDEPEFIRLCNLGVDAGVIFRHGDPTPGAGEALQALRDAGHTLHIITDRSFGAGDGEASRDATREWLYQHSIPFDTLDFTSDKTSVETDMMIDDKPENYRALVAAECDAWLMNQPWNQGDFDEYDRVSSLAQFVENVAQCEEEGHTGTGRRIRTDIVVDHYLCGSAATGPRPPRHGDEIRTVSSTGGEKGVKLARFDLIPALPLRQVAEHYGKGAEKYEARNWERGYEWSKSFGALMRHAWQFWDGEDIDEETGSHHATAVVFHALALLEFTSTHPEFDDRPAKLS